MTCEVTESSKVRLVLPSRAENMTLVRSMVTGVVEAAGIDDERLNAMRTTISEASNNVVAHAYGSVPGPLCVAVSVMPDGVDVLVEDEGSGIRRLAPSGDRMGLGLALISSLADRAEFARRPGGGTRVRMFFKDAATRSGPIHESANHRHLEEPAHSSGGPVASLAPRSLLAQVLGRLCRAAAGQSHFRVRRISELREITNASARLISSAETGPTWFSLSAAPRRLELHVGPVDRESEQIQVAATSGGAQLMDLVDELTIERSGDHDFVRIVVLDHTNGDHS